MAEFERTFDNVAENYDKIRPEYPPELYEDIFRYKPVDAESRALEIGIGTGKATLPVLERNCRISAVEPGEKLADITLEKYKGYKNFSLHRQTLQDFDGLLESYDLIYSATAFHWIPEEYGYKRVYQLLKKGGAFVRFAYHAGQDEGRKELSSELQLLYQTYMKRNAPPEKSFEETARKIAEIADNYGFSDIEYKIYHMTKDFSADEYMELLRTYPDHMKLEQSDREKLFGGIHTAIMKSGGVITVYYTVDLQMARKRL